jgi:hypothetical protein
MADEFDASAPREVTDPEGLAWSCIQAFAGLGHDSGLADKARVPGTDRVHVVCTPSGGARSVRVQLPLGWQQSSDDAALLAAIAAARNEGEIS